MARDGREPLSLLYLIKRAELVVRAQLDLLLADSGVTTPQFTALTVLHREDGVSAAQLARASFVTPQSMADMLGVLEAQGLIRRASNPESRRERLVLLADAGRALVSRYADAMAELEQRSTSEWTPAEITAFREQLARVWRALV